MEKTSPKKWIRAVSNFIALIPTPLICQMMAIFFRGWILKGCIWVHERKKKISVFCSRKIRTFHVVVVQRRQRNEQKKKRDARARLLFYQSKPYCFLPFSLTSPSSLLKVPIELATSAGPEIAAEIQPMGRVSFDGKTGNPFACLAYSCPRNSPTRLLAI